MREILFRGKRIDNGEWVEGYISEHTMIPYDMNQSYIGWVIECIPEKLYEYDWFEVDPETVSQCTGWNDKNDVRIFEGDIVRVEFIGENRRIDPRMAEVAFRDGKFGLIWGFRKELVCFTGFHNVEFEVIGNVHDDPELLEVQNA